MHLRITNKGQFSNHLYPCSRSDMVDGRLHVDGHRRIYRDSLATAHFGYGRVSHGTHRRGVHLYCPYHWCYLGQTDVGAWWVWDARLTSELVLLFLYLGVIALYHAFDDQKLRQKRRVY